MEYIELGKLLNYEQPTKYIVTSTNYNDEYPIPVLTAGQSFILGYTNEKENIFPKDRLPVIIFDDFTTATKFVDFEFKVKSSAMKILNPVKGTNIRYVYYAMQKIKVNSNQHKRYWISQYANIKIPVPTFELQEKIVEELDRIRLLIEIKNTQKCYLDKLIKAQFVEMFKNCKTIKKIGDVIDICRGASPRPINNFITEDMDSVNWIKIGDVAEDSLYIENTKEKITKEGAKKSREVFPGDFILSNSMSFGRPYILKIHGCVHDGWLIMSNFKDTFNELYLYYALRDEEVQNQFSGRVNGATVKNLNSDLVKNTCIKIPALELQNQFSEFVKEIDKQKYRVEKSLCDLSKMYESRLEKYFGSVNSNT